MSKLFMKVAAGVLILLAVGAFFLVKSCLNGEQQAVQHRVDQGQMGAMSNSAADAINTQAAANQREQGSEALSRSNEEEIRNAQGSDARIDPAARDAGLRAVCRRVAYRDTERCRVFQPPAR